MDYTTSDFTDFHLSDLQLYDLTLKIISIISQLKTINKFSETHELFEQLADIQGTLAKAAFKYHQELGNILFKFISDFDRIDDLWWRAQLHDQIITGEYDFENMKGGLRRIPHN